MTRPPGTDTSSRSPAIDPDVLAQAVLLVRSVAEDPVEDLAGDGDEVRVGDPGPVEAVAGLALLVLADACERVGGHLRLAPVRDERRHPADRVGAAPVAGPDEQLAVGAHERHGHRDLAAVGQDELGSIAELLDDAEDVVPAAGVETRRVVAQLVQDLVHLEGGQDRLDEDRRPDRPAREPDGCLARDEDVVPEPGLAMTLELGEVEVRPGSRGPPASAPLWARNSPKSNRLADTGCPSTRTWRSSRCQPRGRTTSVAVRSPSR